ncbi:uncharacterized protein LOC62_07G008894 [Vanrija pseudolonga]|uniref:Uncharacterized protein n=1 Tax=Vanrija pseudolonga TaxID=143232 RepID=A0AAF1BPE9_9TREE|nr:hypothetical protein LOC62_07G008894 [Vanrija pseudolonga]
MPTTSHVTHSGGARSPFPPLALTPTSFPMVWDEILLHADESTFPSLRATSKDLHKRINKKLYEHVGVHLTKSGDRLHIDLLAPYTNHRVPGLDWVGARALCVSRLKSCCLTIDKVVNPATMTLSGVHEADIEAFRSLEVALHDVMSHRRAGRNYASLFDLARLDTVVAFLENPTSTGSAQGELRNRRLFCDLPARFLRIVAVNIELGDTRFRFYDLAHMPKLESVVVNLRKNESQLQTTTDVWRALSSLFLALSTLMPRVKLIISGLELFPDKHEDSDQAPAPIIWEAREPRLNLMTAVLIGSSKSMAEAGGGISPWSKAVMERRDREMAELEALRKAIVLGEVEHLREVLGEELFRFFTKPPGSSVERRLSGDGDGE